MAFEAIAKLLLLLSSVLLSVTTTQGQAFGSFQPHPIMLQHGVPPHMGMFPPVNMINGNFLYSSPHMFYPQMGRPGIWNGGYIQQPWAVRRIQVQRPAYPVTPNQGYRSGFRHNTLNRPVGTKTLSMPSKLQPHFRTVPPRLIKTNFVTNPHLNKKPIPKTIKKPPTPKKPPSILNKVVPHPGMHFPKSAIHRARKKAFFRGIAKAKNFNRLINRG